MRTRVPVVKRRLYRRRERMRLSQVPEMSLVEISRRMFKVVSGVRGPQLNPTQFQHGNRSSTHCRSEPRCRSARCTSRSGVAAS